MSVIIYEYIIRTVTQKPDLNNAIIVTPTLHEYHHHMIDKFQSHR